MKLPALFAAIAATALVLGLVPVAAQDLAEIAVVDAAPAELSA